MTIRVLKADGRPGMTMQDWLIKVGLEGPKYRPPQASSSFGDGGDGSPGGFGEVLRRRHHASALKREAADAVAGRWNPGGGGGGEDSDD